jgi:hypothetical protein
MMTEEVANNFAEESSHTQTTAMGQCDGHT